MKLLKDKLNIRSQRMTDLRGKSDIVYDDCCAFIPKRNKHDKMDHNAIGVVIFNQDKTKLLLQFHNKYQFWTIPVGKKDQGDSLHYTIVKEIKEECDIDVVDYEYIGKYTKKYDKDMDNVTITQYVYELLAYFGEIKNNEPEKHSEFKWFSKSQLLKLDSKLLSDATTFALESILERYRYEN